MPPLMPRSELYALSLGQSLTDCGRFLPAHAPTGWHYEGGVGTGIGEKGAGAFPFGIVLITGAEAA